MPGPLCLGNGAAIPAKRGPSKHVALSAWSNQVLGSQDLESSRGTQSWRDSDHGTHTRRREKWARPFLPCHPAGRGASSRVLFSLFQAQREH